MSQKVRKKLINAATLGMHVWTLIGVTRYVHVLAAKVCTCSRRKHDTGVFGIVFESTFVYYFNSLNVTRSKTDWDRIREHREQHYTYSKRGWPRGLQLPCGFKISERITLLESFLFLFARVHIVTHRIASIQLHRREVGSATVRIIFWICSRRRDCTFCVCLVNAYNSACYPHLNVYLDDIIFVSSESCCTITTYYTALSRSRPLLTCSNFYRSITFTMI